jgi:hypothetical protein
MSDYRRFQAIGSTDIQVYLNYRYDDLCKGYGPFMYVRSHAQEISTLIDPDELIRLMTPPLKFKYRHWSKILFIVHLILVLITYKVCVDYVSAD